MLHMIASFVNLIERTLKRDVLAILEVLTGLSRPKLVHVVTNFRALAFTHVSANNLKYYALTAHLAYIFLYIISILPFIFTN
jgi:hypothetical protein